MLTKPWLLIVEDNSGLRERLVYLMSNPPQSWLRGTGIKGFEVIAVGTAVEAREQLQEALSEGRPFEVVLLDLSLPATREDAEQGKDDPEHGRALLEEIQSFHESSVVILTAHAGNEHENIIHAIRNGAVDFVIKPLAERENEEILFTRLVSAVGKTRERLSQSLKVERIQWLTEDKHRRDRDEVAQKASAQANEIARVFRQFVGVLRRRYAFDPNQDPDDEASELAATIKEFAGSLAQDVWKTEQNGEREAQLEDVDVGKELDDVIQQVHPCYFQRGVTLQWETIPIGTACARVFRKDLELMLSEIVVGCLESLPIHADPYVVKFKCGLINEDKDIRIKMTRSTDDPSEKSGTNLTSGKSPGFPEEGLSFLTRVAENMGAVFEHQQSENEVRLTIRIPVI